MIQIFRNEFDEVNYFVRKTKELQKICNELYTDKHRDNFKGLTRFQIDKIYDVYTIRLKDR